MINDEYAKRLKFLRELRTLLQKHSVEIHMDYDSYEGDIKCEVVNIDDNTEYFSVYLHIGNILNSESLLTEIEFYSDKIDVDPDEPTVNIKLKNLVCNDEACMFLGLNEYCVNEGADGNETRSLPLSKAKEFGLI